MKVIANRVALPTLLLACTMAAGAAAQQPRPAFEVASVRPQTKPATFAEIAGWPRVRPGGRLVGSHATLEWLITYAYRLRAFQVIDGPDWIREGYFELNAKAAAEVPEDQLRLMLQSLLEDRFKLVAHTEQREMRYQALVLARADGQPGPGLRRLDEGACRGKTVAEVFNESFPAAAAAARNRIAGACLELREIAELVGVQLDTLVIDKTGLRGQWVFLAPYSGQPPTRVSARLGAPVPSDPGSAGDPGAPPYAVALEEQLGLKLASATGPVDVLVIHSVQQPSEN